MESAIYYLGMCVIAHALINLAGSLLWYGRDL